MSNNRVVTLLAVKSFLSLIALVLFTSIIHEGAHLVTAVIMKVPILSFTWFDPRYFAPCIRLLCYRIYFADDSSKLLWGTSYRTVISDDPGFQKGMV